MIEIKHLSKKYTRGKEVISDLSLNFLETGLNVVCGKSGCGKTTLINILGGMDLDYEGEVLVDGLNLNTSTYTEIADYRNFTSAFVFLCSFNNCYCGWYYTILVCFHSKNGR